MAERQEHEAPRSLNDFFLIDVQEMRFRNLTVRRYHPRIQMKSIVQYKSELDSGSAHKSHSVLLWFLRLGSYFTKFIREYKKSPFFKWSMVIFTSSS